MRIILTIILILFTQVLFSQNKEIEIPGRWISFQFNNILTENFDTIDVFNNTDTIKFYSFMTFLYSDTSGLFMELFENNGMNLKMIEKGKAQKTIESDTIEIMNIIEDFFYLRFNPYEYRINNSNNLTFICKDIKNSDLILKIDFRIIRQTDKELFLLKIN